MSTLLTPAPGIKADKSPESGGRFYCFDTNTGWKPLYGDGQTFGLRDARKLRATGAIVVPSVTSIFKVLHRQMLVDWIKEQVALAAYLNPPSPSEAPLEYADRITAIADNASGGAMDLGTRIHAGVEAAIKGEDYNSDVADYVRPVMAERTRLGIRSLGVETPCGSVKYGYGGRCDEHAEDFTVLDIKSRKSRKGKVASYSTDIAQCACYGVALFGEEYLHKGRGIVFGVSTTERGVVTTHEFGPEELRKAWSAFLGMLEIYRWENKW